MAMANQNSSFALVVILLLFLSCDAVLTSPFFARNPWPFTYDRRYDNDFDTNNDAFDDNDRSSEPEVQRAPLHNPIARSNAAPVQNSPPAVRKIRDFRDTLASSTTNGSELTCDPVTPWPCPVYTSSARKRSQNPLLARRQRRSESDELRCISFESICDGQADCPNASDEDPAMCIAKKRRSYDSTVEFLQKQKRIYIPKFFGSGSIQQIARALSVSPTLDDYKKAVPLTPRQEANFVQLLKAVDENKQVLIAVVRLPISAWSGLVWLLKPMLDSGFWANPANDNQNRWY